MQNGETVGFVGLGAMGLPMTAVLADNGVSMLVYDPADAARTAARSLSGVEVAESHGEVAEKAGILFTCLPNDAITRDVYLGESGIAAVGRDGLITVDCSTVSPALTREIHEVEGERGIAHLDASMLGSVPQAETGTIGFVVGGSADTFGRVEPYLQILGKMVRHAGATGAGNRVKLIHQTLVAGHAVAVAEALSLCLATDTDMDTFYDIVCNGGGFAYSRYFEKRTPRMREGEFSPLFMLDLMTKDARLARDMARSADLDAPLLDQVVAIFEDAQEQGLGREDFSAVMRLYENRIGQRLQGDG